jgi:DNA mismatch repair protein MutS
MAELTPMMRQYLALKEENPDALLFFRLGDFYELFFEDAKTASRELELTLTGRDCGLAERAPMCGVPWHAADGYVARLIARGYKVAIAEQTEDPAQTKTLVRREVVRVVTPGTVSDSGSLPQKENNFIASAYFAGKQAGAALCDVTTGEFFVRAFPEGEEALASFLALHAPKELITNDPERLKALFSGYISQVRPEIFRPQRAREALLAHFEAGSPQALGLEKGENLAIAPAGALIRYLGDTQKVALRHISRIKKLLKSDTMPISTLTLRSLEVSSALRGGHQSHVLHTLDKTRTAMGGRLLKTWVEGPLADQAQTEARLDCVEALRDDLIKLEEVGVMLARVYDIERLLGKLSYGNLGPRDCLALLRSLEAAPEAQALIAPLPQAGMREVHDLLTPLPDMAGLLSRAIDPDAPALLSDGGVIKAGYNQELDDARAASRDSRQWISDLEARERAATGIKNLKVQYNRVFGYYIEVTKANYALVPERYARRQTLANAERYTTQELNDLEKKALGAADEITRLENALYQEVLAALSQALPRLQNLALGFKTLDALQSLAKAALENCYVRPRINTQGRLDIKNGRHPVVERAMAEGSFVPNDTRMDENERVLIITGPNMAGKSTYMRQTALIALMAHMGSFVPAESADIPLLDNVFTRIGAQDDLSGGQSTFMVEMTELADILRNATSRSLVILDEIGRGTSTLDGLSIAWATVEYLADREKSGALTLFATHYHELSRMEGALPGVVNLSVLTKELGDEVVFLHQIRRGGADKSFGVYVARMAGVPRGVVARARQILARLEASEITQDAIGKNILEGRGKKKNEQMALSEYGRAELVQELAELDVLQMSPMDALNTLYLMKEKARNL